MPPAMQSFGGDDEERDSVGKMHHRPTNLARLRLG